MSPGRQLDPQLALAAFGHPNAEVQSIHHGFSGAIVFKVHSDDLVFALKAYTANWGDAAQLQAIHRRIQSAADLFPQLTAASTSVVESQGCVWDMARWQTGDAVPPSSNMAMALSVCARMHQRWRIPEHPPAPCPSIARQLTVLNQWQSTRVQHGGEGEYADAINMLKREVPFAIGRLTPWLHRPTPIQTIHGDLWTGNMICNHQDIKIIDWASVRMDSTASDLARIGESEYGRGTQWLDEIAASYEAVRPLSVLEWELFHTLSRHGPIARLAQWLIWIVVEHRHFANAFAAKSRYQAILEQAQRVSRWTVS